MSKVKNWMMEMEDEAVTALESGAKTENDVVAFVNTRMSIVDNDYVKKVAKEIMGE